MMHGILELLHTMYDGTCCHKMTKMGVVKCVSYKLKNNYWVNMGICRHYCYTNWMLQ